MKKQEREPSKLIAESAEYNFGDELDGLASNREIVQHRHRTGPYVSSDILMSLAK